MSPKLRERVLLEIARTPAPTRAELRTRTATLTVLGVVATVALFFATGRYAPGERALLPVVSTTSASVVVALALTRALRAGASMLGPPRSVLALAGGGAVAVLALVAVVVPAACWSGPAVPPSVHLACGGLTLLQAALPLAVLALLRRGSDPVHPALTGAALGVVAGAWAAAMAYLRCPHGDPVHCVAAHAAPAVVLAAVGALVGRALLPVRRQS